MLGTKTNISPSEFVYPARHLKRLKKRAGCTPHVT
jgi:hypothetical protein